MALSICLVPKGCRHTSPTRTHRKNLQVITEQTHENRKECREGWVTIGRAALGPRPALTRASLWRRWSASHAKAMPQDLRFRNVHIPGARIALGLVCRRKRRDRFVQGLDNGDVALIDPAMFSELGRKPPPQSIDVPTWFNDVNVQVDPMDVRYDASFAMPLAVVYVHDLSDEKRHRRGGEAATFHAIQLPLHLREAAPPTVHSLVTRWGG